MVKTESSTPLSAAARWMARLICGLARKCMRSVAFSSISAVVSLKACMAKSSSWPNVRRMGVHFNSHAHVIGAGAAFGRDPGDVAGRVLDVAGFAVDAVLGVDAEAGHAGDFGDFIDAGWAVVRRRFGAVSGQRVPQGYRGIGEVQVHRLVLVMRNIGEEDRGRAVEARAVVGRGIAPAASGFDRPEGIGIGLFVPESAEKREAEELVDPHVEAAERDPEDGAEARPERLDVADAVELAADAGGHDAGRQVLEAVAGAAGGERLGDRVGGADAGTDGTVDSLQTRRVHEACGAADQRAAGKHQLGDGLEAARGQRAGAVRDTGRALQQAGNGGVLLEALELVEGRKRGVAVVEVDDEAQIDPAVVGVVTEAATRGGVVERVAEIVVDAAGFMHRLRDLPYLLDTESEFLWARFRIEVEALDELPGQRTPRALPDQRVSGANTDARGKAGLGIAGPIAAEIAGYDAGDGALCIRQHVDGGGHREDVDAKRLRLVAEPADEIAERSNDAVMRPHQRRQQPVGQHDIGGAAEDVEAVPGDRGTDGRTLFPPVGNELGEADRVHHGAGEDMPTDLRGLFDHGDACLLPLLLETNGRREAGRAGADD